MNKQKEKEFVKICEDNNIWWMDDNEKWNVWNNRDFIKEVGQFISDNFIDKRDLEEKIEKLELLKHGIWELPPKNKLNNLEEETGKATMVAHFVIDFIKDHLEKELSEKIGYDKGIKETAITMTETVIKDLQKPNEKMKEVIKMFEDRGFKEGYNKCSREKNSGRVMFQMGYKDGEKAGLEKARELVKHFGYNETLEEVLLTLINQ